MTFVKRYWRIIFPIFFMILIWCFSAQNAAGSDELSLSWAAALGLPNGTVRKLAHMTLFAGLGLSISCFIKSLNAHKYPNATATASAIIFCLCYGAIDEVHQIFVPGRSAEYTDILIDTLGACIGIAVYIAIFCFWRRFRLKHKTE